MEGDARWLKYYKSLDVGFPYIQTAQLLALEREEPWRVIETKIARQPATVVFLDVPFRLGEKIPGVDGVFLRRIPLRDLPGWPPMAAAMGAGMPVPNILNFCLKSARFRRGPTPGQGGVEMDLEDRGNRMKAWLTACPDSLLQCVEATMNEQRVIDNRLLIIQDVRLRSCD